MNPQVLLKLIEKYRPIVLEIVEETKNGVRDYEAYGKKCNDVITSILNISIKDILSCQL